MRKTHKIFHSNWLRNAPIYQLEIPCWITSKIQRFLPSIKLRIWQKVLPNTQLTPEPLEKEIPLQKNPKKPLQITHT
jgi:hypothetical protein